MFHGINLLVVISGMGEDEGYRTEREREVKKIVHVEYIITCLGDFVTNW